MSHFRCNSEMMFFRCMCLFFQYVLRVADGLTFLTLGRFRTAIGWQKTICVSCFFILLGVEDGYFTRSD